MSAGYEFLKEKIGRKQVIAVIGMLILLQAKAPSWQIMAVGMMGIFSQFYIDRIKAKNKLSQLLTSIERTKDEKDAIV